VVDGEAGPRDDVLERAAGEEQEEKKAKPETGGLRRRKRENLRRPATGGWTSDASVHRRPW
jgi:hypothetical protein